MGILHTLMVIIEVLVSFLLVVVILLQKTKQHGAGGLAFGQAMGESLFGTQTGNLLTKATVVLAAIFMVNTTLLALQASNRRGGTGSSVTDRVSAPIPAAVPQPQLPTAAPAPAMGDMPAAGPMPVAAPVEVGVESAVPATPAAAPAQAGADQPMPPDKAALPPAGGADATAKP